MHGDDFMNREVIKIFSSVVLSERTIKIKLLGDSITHGAGGTGFEQNGAPIVDKYSRNPDGYCWAKMFKEYMESQFDCAVTNNGCCSVKIEFIIDNFDTLVDKDDDIIICTIGTNNRNLYHDVPERYTRQEYMKKFYENIVLLNDKFKSAGKKVIFVANIPAMPEKEKDGEKFCRLFHMNDVHDMNVKASADCDFPLIDLYTQFIEYCENRNISMDTLYYDGLHPNDAGYDVMFKLILKELGIANKIK